MPKITITLGSNRPGGIDIALAGLAAQTFKDFEVVFVDGRYHQRHVQVLEAVKKYGIEQPFFHVPNHRNSGTIWGTTCAGYNTGFALASGEIVVMLLDYAYAPPDWLAIHAKHQEEKKILMCPHEYRTLAGAVGIDRSSPLLTFNRSFVDGQRSEVVVDLIERQRNEFDEISIFPEWFQPTDIDKFTREEGDPKCAMPTAPFTGMNYFNTKNESFPLENILTVNGMDENYDRGRGPGDPDLGFRLLWSGLKSWIVREAIVHCLNPRALLPNMNIIIPEDRRLGPPHDHRWYNEDAYRYIATMKAEQRIRAPNPFDIRNLREKIWSWRERSQEPTTSIPLNIVTDKEYYR